MALVRAITSKAPPAPKRANEEMRKLAFTESVGKEVGDRNAAAKKFPTDPWSQDDYFHAAEAQEARAFAKLNAIPVTDALDALDEGLRAQRARGDRSSASTVPPCHPRAIY
jgi:hypothetical protein